MKKILFLVLIMLAVCGAAFLPGEGGVAYADNIPTVFFFDYPSCTVKSIEGEKQNFVTYDSAKGLYKASVTFEINAPIKSFGVYDVNGDLYKEVARGTATTGDYTVEFYLTADILEHSQREEGAVTVDLRALNGENDLVSVELNGISDTDFDLAVYVYFGDTKIALGEVRAFSAFKGEKLSVETVKKGKYNLYSLKGGATPFYFDEDGVAEVTMGASNVSLDAEFGNYMHIVDASGHADLTACGFTVESSVGNMAYVGEDVVLKIKPLTTGVHKGYVLEKMTCTQMSGDPPTELITNVTEYSADNTDGFERKRDGTAVYRFTMSDGDVTFALSFHKPQYQIVFNDASAAALEIYDIVVYNKTDDMASFSLSEAVNADKTFFAEFGDELYYRINFAEPTYYSVTDTAAFAELSGAEGDENYCYDSDTAEGGYDITNGAPFTMTQSRVWISLNGYAKKKYKITLADSAGFTSSATLRSIASSALSYNSAEYEWGTQIYFNAAGGYKIKVAPHYFLDYDHTQQGALTTSESGWYFLLGANDVTISYTSEKTAIAVNLRSAGGDENCKVWAETTRDGSAVLSERGVLMCYVGETITIKTQPSENYELVSVTVGSTIMQSPVFVMDGAEKIVLATFRAHTAAVLDADISLEDTPTLATYYTANKLNGDVIGNEQAGYDMRFYLRDTALPVNVETLKSNYANGVYNLQGNRIAIKDLSVYAVEIGVSMTHFLSGDTYDGTLSEGRTMGVYLPIRAAHKDKTVIYVAYYNTDNGKMSIVVTDSLISESGTTYVFNAQRFGTYLVLAADYDEEASRGLTESIAIGSYTDPMFQMAYDGGEISGGNTQKAEESGLEWYYILLITVGAVALVAAVVLFVLVKSGKIRLKRRDKDGGAKDASDHAD